MEKSATQSLAITKAEFTAFLMSPEGKKEKERFTNYIQSLIPKIRDGLLKGIHLETQTPATERRIELRTALGKALTKKLLTEAGLPVVEFTFSQPVQESISATSAAIPTVKTVDKSKEETKTHANLPTAVNPALHPKKQSMPIPVLAETEIIPAYKPQEDEWAARPAIKPKSTTKKGADQDAQSAAKAILDKIRQGKRGDKKST